jgi:hypothetical protein
MQRPLCVDADAELELYGVSSLVVELDPPVSW